MSWWELHTVLTEHLKHRGFNGAALIALRVLSEGVYPALTSVLLAYWMAIEDARVEWRRR